MTDYHNKVCRYIGKGYSLNQLSEVKITDRLKGFCQVSPTSTYIPFTMPFSYFRVESLPQLRIDISSSELEKVVFTTLDKIFGRIVFSPTKPTIVNDVLIEFLGQANSWIESRTPGNPRRTSCDEVLFLHSAIIMQSS